MRPLTTASAINGLPVVTIDGGEDLAEVRDVIYSPEAGRIVGLTLNKRGFLSGPISEVLPAENVRAIGRDAVMVDGPSALVPPGAASEEIASPDADRNVIGAEVLTESGVHLGKVKDLAVLIGSSGEVVGYQIDRAEGGGGFIPLPIQLSVSGDALLLPDATEEFVHDDLVGLGAAVDEFRKLLGMS